MNKQERELVGEAIEWLVKRGQSRDSLEAALFALSPDAELWRCMHALTNNISDDLVLPFMTAFSGTQNGG